MADYIGRYRSNYFAVKDRKAFEQFCKRFNLERITDDKDKSLVGFLDSGFNGSIPVSIYNEEQDDNEDIDFLAELSTHLAPGHVAIVKEVGYEKMRYLVGLAFAVNSAGEQVKIDLYDIYEKAKPLGKHITACEY